MKFIDLTHPLFDGRRGFPGDPSMGVAPHATVAANKVNVSRITMGSHQGTHLDAMFHFKTDGKTIDQMPLDWFYGPVRVLRIPKKAREEITPNDFKPFESLLTPGARIIYETGWQHEFGTARYFEDFPSLTQDAARYLASKKIKMLGMDTPTPGRDWYEVHHILLDKEVEIVIIESLAHLDQVPDQFTFIGFPLLIEGCDGSPIRAVAMVD
jgi:kynurenine formamidase